MCLVVRFVDVVCALLSCYECLVEFVVAGMSVLLVYSL